MLRKKSVSNKRFDWHDSRNDQLQVGYKFISY